MSLAQILNWTAFEFIGGSSYFRDREAYYAVTKKKIGGVSGLAFDALGASYTYSQVPLWMSYFLGGTDLKYAVAATVARVAGPMICKKINDVQLQHPERSWEAALKTAKQIGNEHFDENSARRLLDRTKEQSQMLREGGHYLAAVQRFSDFGPDLRTEMYKKMFDF